MSNRHKEMTNMLSIALTMSCISILLNCASALGVSNRAWAISQSEKFVPCAANSKRRESRSNELLQIVEEDQKDRQPPIDWNIVSPRDEIRAKRVAEIFAEGCFQSAEDYASAALVFQHGTVPDHYYQAFLWAKKSVDLGKEEQSNMVANAVDRYLMSIGHKQLFAAQTFRSGPDQCVCLGDTELGFPDHLRVEYTGMSLSDRISAVKKRNELNPICSEVVYCSGKLSPPPKGLFPNIW